MEIENKEMMPNKNIKKLITTVKHCKKLLKYMSKYKKCNAKMQKKKKKLKEIVNFKSIAVIHKLAVKVKLS